MEEGCEIKISRGRERERDRVREGMRQGEVERDVASVAAVIKLRAWDELGVLRL